MECRDFRERCGADPRHRDEALAAHEAACARCARFAKRMRELDALIHEAVRVDVPVAQPREPIQARTGRSWLALAASLLLATGIGAALHFSAPPTDRALQRAVVAHLAEEAALVAGMRSAAPPETVRSVLAGFDAQIIGDIGPVLDARICIVGGKEVVHLVVERPSGRVTVMLLPDEPLARPVRIDAPTAAGRVRGRILARGDGSIAIVGHEQPVDAALERTLAEAIRWEA